VAPDLSALDVSGVDPLVRYQLEAAHRHYISTVSGPAMAISLELALFLRALLLNRRPERILDLGSGFSSLVFRRYARDVCPRATVWTVDHDPGWLARTREFLHSHDVSLEEMTTWESLSAGSFDLVFHDLGDMQVRAATLDRVISLTRPGGVLVLDDLQFMEYRAAVCRAIQRHGLRYWDLAASTGDGIGRYSWLIAPG
jgi:predicted O-methyltransferase YrrM